MYNSKVVSGRSKERYQKYLQSNHWRELRDKKVTECYRCFMCHSEKNLALHHLNYERIGKELDNDTVVLCNRCHYKLHFGTYRKKFRKKLKKKYRRMLWFKIRGIVRPELFYFTHKEKEEYETMIMLDYT